MQGRNTHEKRDNRQFAVITYLFLAVFLAMLLYFVWFMLVGSRRFVSSSYNPRLSAIEKTVLRGEITSSDGMVLASSKEDADGNVTRSYPEGRVFAHLVGYNTNGKDGIERTENFTLLSSHAFVLERLRDELSGQRKAGDSIRITADSRVQEAAYSALGSVNGACIAMDPETGAILCLVSKPDFDPNTVAADWDALTAEGSTALLNRATQGAYAPGSTMKIVTALEYLREGGTTEDPFHCDGAYTYDGYTVHCAGDRAHGDLTLQSAFAKSCNVTFSRIGLALDVGRYRDTAEALLFNKKLPGSDLGSLRQSTFSLTEGAEASEIMATAFGQGRTLLSPYHLMLLSSAVADDGVLMKPYVLAEVDNVDGTEVSAASPSEYGRLMTEEEAGTMQGLMRACVTDGTGKKLDTDAYTAYGKTGTAEISDTDKNRTNSWFTGFADNGSKKIALAVIAEEEGASSYATPVAKAIFDAYFSY